MLEPNECHSCLCVLCAFDLIGVACVYSMYKVNVCANWNKLLVTKS